MRRAGKRILSMGLAWAMLLTAPLTVRANEVTGTLGTEEAADVQQAADPQPDTQQAPEQTADPQPDVQQAPEDAADDNVVIAEDDKPYLALGADLSEDQRNTVLALMGIDPGSLDQYDVVTVTNDEEHAYLGDYIDASRIGSKSWSSVVIVKKDAGSGINISTKNISYCTVGMYKNALVTAGIADADIIVAAPQNISGTAALVGVFKAYEEMTGEELPEDSVDTALNELVLTGELVSDTGADSEQVEGLVAYLKQQVAENGLDDEESIGEAIDEAAEQFEVDLTEEQRQQLIDLLLRIGELDLDVDQLMSQAQSVYDKISEMDFGSDGFWDSVADFFKGLWDGIVDFFTGLFQ